jgi:hypothetical protein
MDTMTTETAPVEEAKPATEEATTNAEGTESAEGSEAGDQPAGGDDVETLKSRLATAEDEADRAKRFIVNFVSGKVAQDPERLPDTFAGADSGALIEEFKENPIGLLDKHFATRMAPIVADNLEARAKDNRTRAMERLGKETWDEYGDAIDNFMGGLSLHTRANPGSYEEALHFVRARNIDKEVDKRVNAKLKAMEDEKRSSVEGSGSRSGASIGSNGRPPSMTEVERQVAKGFGMTEKEWMKYKTPRSRANG